MNRSLLERYFKGNVTDCERCKVAEWVAKSQDNLNEYMAARRLYDSVLLSDEFNDAQLSIPKLNSRRMLRTIKLETIFLKRLYRLWFFCYVKNI